MSTVDEQISDIQKEIRETPYHKGTEHHIGRLRAKLSKLKTKQDESGGKKGGGGGGYNVKKQGDATVVLVGAPSVGKSTLLNALTNAQSKIAPYAFTTVTVIPGMMKYNHANIQILDVPGLIEGAEEGKGRGREVLSVVRGADLLLLMTDVNRLDAPKRIREALERNGIRLNKTPPNVKIEKKMRGGTVVRSNIKQDLDKQTIIGVANEFGYKNVEVTIREKLTMETLIDSFAKNRVYIPELLVVNKSDHEKPPSRHSGAQAIESNTIHISAEKGLGLDTLRQAIFDNLNLMIVYLVRKDEEPSNNNPLVIKKGLTLGEVAKVIGSDFAEDKKNAKIWGPSAKHAGQIVSLKYKATENLQIQFI
jgi:hypothetical protein